MKFKVNLCFQANKMEGNVDYKDDTTTQDKVNLVCNLYPSDDVKYDYFEGRYSEFKCKIKQNNTKPLDVITCVKKETEEIETEDKLSKDSNLFSSYIIKRRIF